MIYLIFELLRLIIGLLIVVLIVHVVISWLLAFDIVSRRQPVIASLWEFTTRLTDPLVRPLRRLIPPIAGVDLSILVLLLALSFLQGPVSYWLEGVLRGGPVL